MPDCSSSSHTNPVILQLLLPLPLLLLLLLLAPMVQGGRFSTACFSNNAAIHSVSGRSCHGTRECARGHQVATCC